MGYVEARPLKEYLHWVAILLLAVLFFWAFNKAIFEPLMAQLVSLVGDEVTAAWIILAAVSLLIIVVWRGRKPF